MMGDKNYIYQNMMKKFISFNDYRVWEVIDWTWVWVLH